jgi:hypothetical protein
LTWSTSVSNEKINIYSGTLSLILILPLLLAHSDPCCRSLIFIFILLLHLALKLAVSTLTDTLRFPLLRLLLSPVLLSYLKIMFMGKEERQSRTSKMVLISHYEITKAIYRLPLSHQAGTCCSKYSPNHSPRSPPCH